jgi:hypothetical protein
MPDSMNAGPHSDVWAAIRTYLENARRAAMREIRHYPQPIAGCDAQIPHLWEATRRDGAPSSRGWRLRRVTARRTRSRRFHRDDALVDSERAMRQAAARPVHARAVLARTRAGKVAAPDRGARIDAPGRFAGYSVPCEGELIDMADRDPGA